MARKIAFLSTEDLTDFVCDDALALPALEAAGFEVETISWRTSRDLSGFEAALIRSTWDYQHHLPRFLSALERIASQTRLLNPLHVVRWNSHKGYLLELASKGVPVVPTRRGRGLEPADLEAARAAFSTEQLIVKPPVSANAHDTYRIGAEEPDERLAAIFARFEGREVMLQPFLPDVLEGERSLFYFGGALSHVIRKVPKAGDFRVQEEHGGDIRAVPDATLEDLAVAERALDALGETLLYARVDLVSDEAGQPRLMELELIEPALYFRTSERAANNFAEALKISLSEG